MDAQDQQNRSGDGERQLECCFAMTRIIFISFQVMVVMMLMRMMMMVKMMVVVIIAIYLLIRV